MMVDDMIFGPPPGWTNAPPNGCSVVPASFNANQTAEPELLRK
jgi:hypothetical protein